MREVQRRQMQFGQVAIGDIWLDPKSRDDIPAVLKGLQHLHVERRDELFGLLEAHIRPGTDRTVGRPGMDLWRILVLGVLKQGLGCDFDRLHDLANNHRTVRAMLAHGDFADESRYELQTLIDNVSLMTPKLLSAVGRLVVDSGHAVARKKPGGPLRGRCDSFAVETDVHYPTDVSLVVGRDAVFDPGGGAGGQAARGGRLAPVAASFERRRGLVQRGALDAAREGPSGAGEGVSGALRVAARAGRGDAEGAGGERRRGGRNWPASGPTRATRAARWTRWSAVC